MQSPNSVTASYFLNRSLLASSLKGKNILYFFYHENGVTIPKGLVPANENFTLLLIGLIFNEILLN